MRHTLPERPTEVETHTSSGASSLRESWVGHHCLPKLMWWCERKQMNGGQTWIRDCSVSVSRADTLKVLSDEDSFNADVAVRWRHWREGPFTFHICRWIHELMTLFDPPNFNKKPQNFLFGTESCKNPIPALCDNFYWHRATQAQSTVKHPHKFMMM